MKRTNVPFWLTLIALTLLLAGGCAKKPAPEVVAPPPAPMEEEKPMAEQMPSQEVRGIQEQEVGEMPVAPEMAEVAGLQRIHFDFDQYTLTDQARKTLADNAKWMKDHPGAKVVIEGHCDERGSDEYNLALGERRAIAAQSYLVSLGIDSGRLSTISYGEERPLEEGHSESVYAKNRRAEFKVLQ